MLVAMLQSHTGNGAAESVLAVTHQGTTADRQGVVINVKVSPPTANIPTSVVRVPPSTVRVPPLTAKVSSPTVRVPQLTNRVPSPTAKVPMSVVKMSLILQH
jgi:hypothetical protein